MRDAARKARARARTRRPCGRRRNRRRDPRTARCAIPSRRCRRSRTAVRPALLVVHQCAHVPALVRAARGALPEDARTTNVGAMIRRTGGCAGSSMRSHNTCAAARPVPAASTATVVIGGNHSALSSMSSAPTTEHSRPASTPRWRSPASRRTPADREQTTAVGGRVVPKVCAPIEAGLSTRAALDHELSRA